MTVLPKQPEVNIGTAGHVDHGKTTLVQAITGVWTARHSEELKRGITIKIGYADAAIFECDNHEGPERFGTSPTCALCGSEARLRRVLSFVDCPGHESLMANMLSGTAVMDGAVLVIAADEDVPRPQTKEHLAALEIMGIKNIVIVQNKVDRVSRERAIENYEKILDFISGTIAEGAPIIPVSSLWKKNVDAVLEAIEKYIPTPKRNVSAPTRMLIIRSFDINKPGTSYSDLKGGVIGGSIVRGELKVGDEIEIVPGYMTVKDGKVENAPLYAEVKSLQVNRLKLEKAGPGGLVGVGTSLDPSLTKADGLVGCVAGKPGTLPPVVREIEISPVLFEHVIGTEERIRVTPVTAGEPLRLNIGPAVTLGIARSVSRDRITLTLKRPVAAEKRDHVVIARQINRRWRLIGYAKIE